MLDLINQTIIIEDGFIGVGPINPLNKYSTVELHYPTFAVPLAGSNP